MILLRAFFPIFIVLFIGLPIMGWKLGEKGKLGTLIGALVGVILVTVMLFTVSWNILSRKVYTNVFFIVTSLLGLVLGIKLETSKGLKFGRYIGLFVGLGSAFLINFLFQNYAILFVWIGTVVLTAVIGGYYNPKINAGKQAGLAIGIVLDICILAFFMLGFSVQ